MDISWFNALPDSVRQMLIGAGGDFIGGLAGQVTAGLLGSVSGRIRRKLEGTPREQALAYAVARAVAQTVQSRTQDRDEAKGGLVFFCTRTPSSQPWWKPWRPPSATQRPSKKNCKAPSKFSFYAAW